MNAEDQELHDAMTAYSKAAAELQAAKRRGGGVILLPQDGAALENFKKADKHMAEQLAAFRAKNNL